VGRSGFPDRDTWQQRLENAPESDLLAQKIEQIQTLEALGAQVQVVQADVSNLDQMTQVAAQIQQQWGAVHGIFHAAGVPGKGIIQLKTPDLLASVLKPKVEGTMVLTQVFQTHQPDFMVVFSSLSTLIGGLGQVDYCGANAFLDAVAESTDLATQTRIIAIDWDAWQEVGMGADQVQRSDAAQAQHNALLDRGIPPAKGIEILMRVLEQRLSRVVISPRPHSLFNQSLTQLAQTLEQALIPSQTETTQVASPGGKYERTLKTPYVAPRTPLEEEVAQLWTELLGIEPIGIEDNFFEIGGHSLLAVQIVSRLRERYGVDLPLRTLLSEAPTIAGMAGTIAQNLPNSDQLDDMNQLLSEIENLSVEEARAQLLASQQPLA
jgi:NAD(P)-dependent dehydrogenase (short-subunit alcohol dehydrogenase family)/acyl carrier protein